MNRSEFILQNIKEEDRVLEIGPLNNPLVCRDEYKNVFYCDIRGTDEIKQLYSGSAYLQRTALTVELDSIVDIDYVLKGSYQTTFHNIEKFDAFVACHVVEHIPNIIRFFNDIPNVLKPGAKLLLVYPDRRYCFDHFRFGTSFRDAYDVYHGGESRTARLGMDFFYSTIQENDPIVFWDEEKLRDLTTDGKFEEARTLYNEVENGKIVDDAHYWIFADTEFLQFLHDGIRAGLIPFAFRAFYPTEKNTQEFFVVLEFVPDIINDCRETLNKLQAEIHENTDFSRYLKISTVFSQQEEKLARCQEEIFRINSELKALENSTSWKLTAPIQKIVEWVKKISQRNNGK